jgi:hypothetical protein
MKLINLAKKYNYTCYWCKQKYPLEDLSRDHVVPLNNRWAKRDSGDILLACIFCNQKRGNKSFFAFKEQLADEKREHKRQLDRLFKYGEY